MTPKGKKPSYWNEAKKYLKESDPVISNIISVQKNDSFLTRKHTTFQTFFKIIIGQQISIEAASSIERRIRKKIKSITPKKLINVADRDLRELGLSFRKIKYIKEIAEICIYDSRFFLDIKLLSDSEAIKSLSSLYGIGPWSAEMFLIFQLNRQNILPTGDVGLINSFCKNYQIDKKDFLIEVSKQKLIWEPYCTVATWYLWRDIDEDTVQY
ncbi:MAG: DNA-3-methyladenine glycosylase 2 family protein [Gammaproteobacteria bacterium]|nr:DNA-3-methyladenine glycosylase 2 family protein [Gammaproteobacteria bacterium]